MSLRSQLIRLAHQNPELREHLLPLLTEQGGVQVAGAVRSGGMEIAMSDSKPPTDLDIPELKAEIKSLENSLSGMSMPEFLRTRERIKTLKSELRGKSASR